MNTFLALPGILLAIAFAAFLGPGFSNLVLALAIGGWAGYARLVRAQVHGRARPRIRGCRAFTRAPADCASSSATSCPTSHSRFWCRPPSAWPASSLPKPRCRSSASALPRPRQAGVGMLNDARNPPLRLAAHGAVPRRGHCRSGARLQLPRRRPPRPTRPAHAAGDRPVNVDSPQSFRAPSLRLFPVASVGKHSPSLRNLNPRRKLAVLRDARNHVIYFARRSTCICIPFFARSVNIASGSTRHPGVTRSLNRCASVARISTASVIANDAPIQIRGPNPNGR